MSYVSKKVAGIKPSPTLAADARAKALIKAGEDIVNLGAGEPDFHTPELACDAGIAAIQAGITKYGPVAGLPILKEAVVDTLKKEQGLDYRTDQVLISVGAKHSLANFFQAVLDPGDEVIIPAPYWVSYPAMIALAGGKMVAIPTSVEADFIPDPKAIEEALTDRTKVLCLNSPGNPTGAGVPREVIEEVVRIAIENDLLICSDEIYRRLVYDGFDPLSPAQVSGAAKDHTLVINGVSKTYAMTGWRIGWAAGPQEIIKAMTVVQSQTTSGPAGINQHGAVGALSCPPEVVETMVRAFDERKNLVVKRLREIPGVICAKPCGAFYVFPEISAYLGRKTSQGKEIATSLDMQDYLLEVGKVAVVAGAPFGAEGHLRLSFAASTADLTKAMDRVAEALGALK